MVTHGNGRQGDRLTHSDSRSGSSFKRFFESHTQVFDSLVDGVIFDKLSLLRNVSDYVTLVSAEHVAVTGCYLPCF